HYGIYFVQSSMIHVRSPLGSKVTQVHGSSPGSIAMLLLSELVRETSANPDAVRDRAIDYRVKIVLLLTPDSWMGQIRRTDLRVDEDTEKTKNRLPRGVSILR